MLKDIFEKQFKNKNAIDKILGSLIDGYVDVKMYRDKQLVYHDTGDNVVTDWMRHAILMMLVGKSVMKNGNNLTIGNDKTKPAGNSSNNNPNGYILNGEQYNWSFDSLKGETEDGYFALYPTKILLGTKKEYTSWDELVADNSSNQEYLTELISIYSDGDDQESAQTNFNNAVAHNDNYYSATIGSQGYYIDNNTNSNLMQTVTINDSNTSGGIPVAETNMHKQFGVVGAVKTIITNQGDENLVESLDENNNKLVKGKVRGTGKPCFIYFNRGNEEDNEWAQQNAAEIFLTADNNSRILNRITFKITMPAQTASNGNLGKYYPYNGYTLKQIGLFNDAYMTKDGETTVLTNQMPSGMLLAVKNIEAFTKTAEETVVLTWTLTI
jgi:hypothetical protein